MTETVANINRLVRTLGMADESHYFLELADLPIDSCVVESIQMSNFDLTNINFETSIKILSSRFLALQDIISRDATFSLLMGGELSKYYGYLHGIEEAAGKGDYNGYQVTLKSPLFPLTQNSHNRVFIEQDSVAIARQLLQDSVPACLDVTVECETPETRPMTVQYEESDWSFIERLLAKDGIFVNIHHQSDGFSIVLSDDLAKLPQAESEITLPFKTEQGAAIDSESIQAIRMSVQSSDIEVSVRDYSTVTAQGVIGNKPAEDTVSPLKTDLWGANVADNDQADLLAERIQSAHLASKVLYLIKTDARNMQPGANIELTGHPEYSGRYVVKSVEFSGSQSSAINESGSGASKGFKCYVTAWPSSVTYKPMYTPRAATPTSFAAKITGEVDETGAYKVQYPFDDKTQDSGDTSLPTNMMQPFGGQDHGMHFPLIEGTEVMVSCMNGDVDRPIIMGALSNDQTPSVVTSENAYENKIRTRSEHEFVLDDTPSSPTIKLHTKDELNRLVLLAGSEDHKAELHSETGDVNIEAGKQMLMSSGADFTIEVGENFQSTVQGDSELMTEEGDITQQAAGNITLTAGEDINWTSTEGDMNVTAGGEIIVEIELGQKTHVVTGDNDINVTDGDFNVDASADVSMAAGESLTFTTGGGSLQIDSGGNITLDGSAVEVTADSIAIKGGSIGNN